MADDVDIATETQQRILDSIIERGRLQAAHQPHRKAGDPCENECGDPAQPGGAYCSSECAEDHRKRNRLAMRAGS